ncbi:hypothetical protein [[Clostridium] aminophilum]|uniref:hypothetical protein n=1 Tax=[Clostridium] aminophilum TaxID=1526 RepID=UPI00332FF5A9
MTKRTGRSGKVCKAAFFAAAMLTAAGISACAPKQDAKDTSPAAVTEASKELETEKEKETAENAESTAEAETASEEVSETGAAAETGLHLTQTKTVGKQTYTGVKEYKPFLKSAKPWAVIPGLNEGMIPQGMCYCAEDKRTYIASYSKADIPSVISVLDEDGILTAEAYLYNADGSRFSSHVGGLAISDDTLFVSAPADAEGHYQVAEIPMKELEGEGTREVKIQKTFRVPVSPSFMNFSDGCLWVGNFYHPKGNYDLSADMNYTTKAENAEYGCYILGYDLSKKSVERFDEVGPDGYPVPDMVMAAPDRIQGITSLSNGQMLLSQSYGRKSESRLMSFDTSSTHATLHDFQVGSSTVPGFILDSNCLTKAVTALPMTEAVSAASDGMILVSFESGALHYSDGKDRTDHIWKMEW